jgi:hypothetical protein
MRLHTRLGFKVTTAVAVTLAPLGAVPVASSVVQTAAHPQPKASAAAQPSPAPPPWRTEPRTTIEGRILPGDHRTIRVDTPKGAHVWTASALLDHDLPEAALHAYKSAAAAENAADPTCRLPWTLLAGIGRVESNHGRFAGSVLGSDGISRPTILGVPLNGVGPVAAIADTDRGRWDGDTVWDRAVGPMQFIPSTWASAGRDGDGDGVKSPNDLNDAALAAAGYLCAGSGSLRTEDGMRAAIFRYNPSDYYVSLVMAFARGYQTGSFVIPSPPDPKTQADKAGKNKADKNKAVKAAKNKAGKGKAKNDKAARGKAKAANGPKSAAGSKATKAGKSTSKTSSTSTQPSGSKTSTSTPSTGGGSSSSGSSSSPSPSPSPSDSPTEILGVLAESGGAWTVGDHQVDFSGAGQATLDKLNGLTGQTVTVTVDAQGVVQTLNGDPV